MFGAILETLKFLSVSMRKVRSRCGLKGLNDGSEHQDAVIGYIEKVEGSIVLVRTSTEPRVSNSSKSIV